MPLIASPRHREDDLRSWAIGLAQDEIVAQMAGYKRRVSAALDHIAKFVARTPRCYVGVSWGKDSVVVADMVMRLHPEIPLVWVKVEPAFNPDCLLVRDSFLSLHPSARYEEITIHMRRDANGWHSSGTLEAGIRMAGQRFGIAYIGGVRAQESRQRRLRDMRYGAITTNTCAPITKFSGDDVFAYLYERDLPVHPAYACSQGGIWPRERIRVSSLGGRRGDGMGRSQWEDVYYPEAKRFR